MRMAQGSPASPCQQDDKLAAAAAAAVESGATHPGSLEDEDYENCEIIVDEFVESDGSMSDPFEDANKDIASPLVNGVDRVPSYDKEGEIVLPARFSERCSYTTPMDHPSDDIWTHADDIATALSWLRQEIRKLKQQDKELLRQFLDLRATIHGYLDQAGPRPRVHSYGCPSDESDATPSPAAATALLSPEHVFVEFRPRTVSLLNPKNSYHVPVRDKGVRK